MALPKGYTQVEYIGATGKQYIDTNFKPTSNTRVTLDFYVDNVGSSAVYIFGARTNNNALRYDFLWSASSGAFASMLYNGDTSQGYIINGVPANGRHFVDKNKRTTTLDGVSITNNNTNVFSASYNMYIGSANSAGTALSGLTGRIYSCRIYDNDTLVRDYVPCKNSSGAIGMYDLANGAFYTNSGSGSFTAGEEISFDYKGYVKIGGVLKPLTGEGYFKSGNILYPITTSSKVKIGNVLKSLLIGTEPPTPSRLPKGYTEVEYIQSNKSQSQYLDTGFASTAGWKAELGWMFTETPSAEQDIIALAYQSGSKMWREYVIARNNQWSLGHYTNSGYGGTAAANVLYDIEASTVSGNGYLNINGSQIFKYTTTYSAHTAHNLYVFAMNYKGAETFTSGRLYYLRLYNQSGTLVRDFVPCKNSSGTAGVYDLVEGKFYTNSGSGSFTAGAEVEV